MVIYLEIIDCSLARPNNIFYAGETHSKVGVNLESVDYILRLPTEQEKLCSVAINHGIANYLTSKLYKMFGIESEYVELAMTENNIYTSMSRDFLSGTQGKFYSMYELLGVYGMSKTNSFTEIYNITSDVDEMLFNGKNMLSKRLMEMIVVDFLINNKLRDLRGYGVIIHHKTFANLAPEFGGSGSFGSGLVKETVRDYLNNDKIAVAARRMEFTNLYFEGDKLIPYSFISKAVEDSDLYSILNSVTSKDYYGQICDIVNNLYFLPEYVREYIIRTVVVRLKMVQ